MEINRCFGCMEEINGYPCSHCGFDPAKQEAQEYALRPGTILNGKYLVGNVLGQGGFGITYVGLDLALERKVAIKEYFPSGHVGRKTGNGTIQWYATEQAQTARGSGREMFLKEARKMNRVSSVHQVVQVLDLFQENNTAYIIMEFVEGQTLKEQLKKTGPLSWKDAWRIFQPVLSAMEKVHQAGLIHRDLSPDNLMLQPDGGVKILDLGAAKDLNINSGASSMQVAKGGFSPLEQYVQRGGSGTWTDVYSVAATMYYTLTGVLPPSAIDRMDNDTLDWNLPRLQALPPVVIRALKKAMALRAADRTQTMAELAAGLEGTLSVNPPKPPKPVFPKWVIPAAAAAAVIAVVILIVGLKGGSSEKEKTVFAGKGNTASPTVAAVAEDQRPGDFDEDMEYTAMVSAGTQDIYTLANGVRVELYFDKQDNERCRIVTDQDGQRIFAFAAEYDDDGNMTEHRMYDGDGKLQRLDISQYNADGKQTTLAIYDGGRNLLRISQWTYDKQGRDVSLIRKDSSGNVLFSGSSQYDSDGAETYSWNRSDGTSGISYYDADGNCLEYSGLDAEGKQKYRGEYSYDSAGRTTQLRYYDKQDVLRFLDEYQYDGDKLVRRVSHSYYNGESISTDEILYGPRDVEFGYKYISDSFNKIYEDILGINEVRVRSYGTTLDNGEYDSNDITFYNWLGDQTGSESYRLDGSVRSKSEYYLDAAGYQTGHTYTSYSSFDNTYTVTEYDADNKEQSKNTYYENGALKEWSEYRYEGSRSWEKTYDADGTLTGSCEKMNNEYGDLLWEKSYNADGSLKYENEYHYDSKGVKTGRTWTWYNSWNNTKEVTEYDAQGEEISKKTYDASGKLIKTE